MDIRGAAMTPDNLAAIQINLFTHDKRNCN
jgi:hypothetical protein